MRILHPLQQDWILGLALIFCGLWHMARAIDVGDRLELMVDDFLCESMENVHHMHSPVDRGEVMRFDQPWEERLQWVWEYGSGKRTHSFLLSRAAQGRTGRKCRRSDLCCRVSGWHSLEQAPLRPLLNKRWIKNNIILSNKAPFSHNFSPFLDLKSLCQGFPVQGIGRDCFFRF